MPSLPTIIKSVFHFSSRGSLQPAESASQSQAACSQPKTTHVDSDLQRPGSVLCSESQVQVVPESNVYPGTISPQRSLEYSGDQDSSSYNVEYLFIFFDQY